MDRTLKFSDASTGWTSSHDVAPPSPKKRKFAASSCTPVPERVVVALQKRIKKINDDVHLVYSPMGRPSVDIVFFHGFQWEGNQMEHIKTWVSRGGSKLWIRWILEDIPDARIFITSYDACTRRTSMQGNMDVYRTAENLMHSLTGRGAAVGQYGCPVVMVGHCVGEPVMEKLCVLADSIVSRNPSKRVENFLNSVRGFFFYASPRQGISCKINICTKISKGALLKYSRTLGTEASRAREEFCTLRQSKGWRTFAIGEGREVTLVSRANAFVSFLLPPAQQNHFRIVNASPA